MHGRMTTRSGVDIARWTLGCWLVLTLLLPAVTVAAETERKESCSFAGHDQEHDHEHEHDEGHDHHREHEGSDDDHRSEQDADREDRTVFGPKRFERHKGSPTVYNDSFERCEGSDRGRLQVWNGNDKATRISAAQIFVNGDEIFGERDFKKTTDFLEKTLPLQKHNTLRVVLKSGDYKEPAFLRVAVQCRPAVVVATPPTIGSVAPSAGALLNSALSSIAATFTVSAGAAAIDPTSVRLLLDGNDRTSQASIAGAGLSYLPPAPLSEGSHSVAVSVADLAGQIAERTWTFTIDTVAPRVQITSQQNGQFLKTPTITVVGSLDDATASVTVNGANAAVASNSFSLAGVQLAEGENHLTAVASDRAGNSATDSVLVTLDTQPPRVTLSAPLPGLLTRLDMVGVAGSADEAILTAAVNGYPAELVGSTFTLDALALVEGENLLTATVGDRAGNPGTVSVTVLRDSTPPAPPLLDPLTSPTNLRDLLLSGTAEAGASVRIFARRPGAARDELLAVVAADGAGRFAVPVTLTEGTTLFSASASDAAGNESPASAPQAVTLDTAAPLITIVAPLTGLITNQLVVAVEGMSNEPLTQLSVNGADAVLSGLNFSLAELPLLEAENSVVAVGQDLAGNQGTASIKVVRDTVAPVITVTAPADRSVSDALEIRVVGNVSEAATLTLGGRDVALSELGFDHPLVLLAGENRLLLQATDVAGNLGVASLTLYADSTPPTITLSSPPDGLRTRSPSVTVVGALSEPASLTLNGTTLILGGLAFSAAQTLVEGENLLTLVAVDAAANLTSAERRVILDTSAPSVSFGVATSGAAGSNLPVTLGASDASGLSLLELRVGGVPLWSATPAGAADFSEVVTYTLPPILASGAEVALELRVIDSLGNAVSVPAKIAVAAGASGPGALLGEVYDDRRGLRLAGVAWQVSSGASILGSGVTGAEGDYFLELPAGDYLVRLERNGYTAVERQLTIRPEQTATVFDARLTPLNAERNLLGPLGGELRLPLGGAAKAPALVVTQPEGALSEEYDLRLTPLSNQGLPGLLPVGWSPLAAFELRILAAIPGATPSLPSYFAEAAALQLPLPAGLNLPAGSAPLLARYDAECHLWVAAASSIVAGEAQSVESTLVQPGTYALLLPDPAPCGPPPVVAAGDLPAAASLLPDYAILGAAGRVVPIASPAAVGITVVGEIVLKPLLDPAPTLVSGLAIAGRVIERFDLASGATLQPADYVQDLLLYRTPCVTNPGYGAVGEPAPEGSLRTTFPVAPSRDYTLLELQLGQVGVEIRPADRAADGAVMVGVNGARLGDADGNVLEIPAGALTRTTPVATRSASGASALVGADFRLLRGVSLDLAGATLGTSAILAVPAPDSFDPALPVLVAVVIEVGGAQRLKLVGSGRVAGSMLVSSLELAPGLSGMGLVRSGLYLFLQAKSSVGFVRGVVTAPGGGAFAGALVSAEGQTLVDLSAANGRYLLAASVGASNLTALDLVKNNGGSAVATLTANAAVTLDLAIAATPPRVIASDPVHGASAAAASAPLTVTFSEPIDRASVNDATLVLRAADGSEVPGVFSFSPDGTVVTFYPATVLQSQSGYRLILADGIRDLQGYRLGATVTVAFTTRDTTPPPRPPAGAIGATFPDADGLITVSASQGSVEAGCTVLLINDASGEIVGVNPLADGSFTGKIAGQLGDEIQVVMLDAAGNQTLISYLTFKSSDGRTLVTARGGQVEGEGGLLLDIPEGALAGPAVVRITPVLESALLHPVPAEARYLAAVNVDTGGVPFQKEVKLSLPVPDDLPADAFPFVATPFIQTNPDGTAEEVYQLIDTAKIVNGRLTTASPPFVGVQFPGIFAFLTPVINFGGPVIVSGIAYQELNEQPGYQLNPEATREIPRREADGRLIYSYDQPVKGAVVRSPAAYNFVSHADSRGHYSAFGFAHADVCRPFSLTAIHPLTMYRHTADLITCGGPYIVKNFNFRLADLTTVIPDATAPAVTLGVRVAPGQPGDPRLLAGTVPVGTELEVAISAVDQELERATLTVDFQTPEMVAPQVTPVGLAQAAPVLVTAMTPERPAIFRYDFTPGFSGQAGSSSTRFKPSALGSYTLIVEATDKANHTTTRRLQLRTVNPGEQPASLDGPPRVDEILPGAGAKEVMVTTPIVVTFSEAVENVSSATLQLSEVASGTLVPTLVYTSVEGGRMRATLVPRSNLAFATGYRVTLAAGITDAVANPSYNNVKLPLQLPVTADFTTKAPRAFDLAAGDQFAGGRDIDLYTTEDGQKTYAYVTAGYLGRYTLDITDPTHPALVHSDPSPTSSRSMRGVSVEQSSGVLGVTENITYASGGQYGYLRLYDLAVDPIAPPNIGREKLAEAYSGIPGRLDLAGNYAYIATAGSGLQVVDLDQVRERGLGGAVADGSTIVGGFNSATQEYGEPNDAQVYGPGKLLVTTNSGYLLLFSVAVPSMPQLSSAYRPDGYQAVRAAAVSGYQYNSADGSPLVIDLAVTAGLGRLQTVDVSDPSNPQLLGSAVDEQGAPVVLYANDIAINPAAGLVFVTTFGSIQVFDIKDPLHPKRLANLAQLPDENGSLLPFGSVPALVEKDGWVYLASDKQGMRVLDLDPHLLKLSPDPIQLDGQVSAKAKRDVNIRADLFPDRAFAAVKAYVVVYEGDSTTLWQAELNLADNLGINTTVVFPAATAKNFDQSNSYLFDANKRYYAGVRLVDANGSLFEQSPEDRISIPLSWPALSTDYNHDRKIDQSDADRVAKGDIFYFWINDDDDSGEVDGSDIPGQANGLIPVLNLIQILDYENTIIDGVRDLIDFFPVVVDAKPLTEHYPPATHRYRLKSSAESVKVAFPQLTKEHVGDYLTVVETARNLAQLDTYKVMPDGVFWVNIGDVTQGDTPQTNPAQDKFDLLIRTAESNENAPVMLVEGRKEANAPLTLEALDTQNRIVFTSELKLSLAGVEQMFRQKNLIQDGDGPPVETGKLGEHEAIGGERDRLGQPGNCPDNECLNSDGKDFVFVHGYNVNGQQARGWQAEIFKRMFWSGSKSRFWGVSWNGADTQFLNAVTLNYHLNVQHAFKTAPKLTMFLNENMKGPVTIAAHSLGNMLASFSLNDSNLSSNPTERLTAPISNFIMIDAAVALEAYTGDNQNPEEPYDSTNSMVHPDWYGYQKRLGASEWHTLFDPADDRSKLTWRNRFANLPNNINYFNFYSSGEEVLDTHTGDPGLLDIVTDGNGRYAWALQEKLKGRMLTGMILGSRYGGWKFNIANDNYFVCNQDALNGTQQEDCALILPPVANNLNAEQLKMEPFFDKSFPVNIFTDGILTNLTEANRTRLLAETFPALTYPVGGPEGERLSSDETLPQENVINMQTTYSNDWPEKRKNKNDYRWLHSDIREVSYVFINELFNTISRK